MIKQITKQELVKIIEENFTSEFGLIDLKGLTFSKDVDLSEMKVKGSLYQDKQDVEGNLYQGLQKVGIDLYQSGLRVKGRTYN